MRDLPVDATMVGKEVNLRPGAVVVREASGRVYEVSPGDKFRPREAPTYLEVEAAGGVPPGTRVLLTLLPGGHEPPEGDDLGAYSVEWDRICHVADPLLMAYLDDVTIADELYLMRPFTKLLREKGPKYGVRFTKRAKNYVYVLRRFADAVRALYPDAIVVDDDSPGSSPSDQLKQAVERHALMDPENASKLLITVCGVESLMGSPFRYLEMGDNEAARVSAAWIDRRLSALVAKTGQLFPHLGDEAVTDRAARLGFEIDREAPCLPASEAQLRNLVARDCLGRRHNHNVRVLPPALTGLHTQKIDDLLCAVMAGIMKVKMEDLSPAQRRRILLPARWGGSMPGATTTSEAQFLNASLATAAQLENAAKALEVSGSPVPTTLRRVVARTAGLLSGEVQPVTVMELAVSSALEKFNDARANPGAIHQDMANSRGGLREALDPEAAAQVAGARAALGGGEGGMGGLGTATPPAPLTPLTLEDLGSLRLSAKALSEPFLRREYAEIAAMSTHQEARLMDAACLKSAGSVFTAVPSAPLSRWESLHSC